MEQEARMKTVKPQVHEKSVSDAQDGAKVKLGAMTPAFPQVKVAPRDGDKLRMGAMSPAFPKR
jgi:hypothetical protein